MGACEPGQGRKSAAISGNLQVRWTSHRGPRKRVQGSAVEQLNISPPRRQPRGNSLAYASGYDNRGGPL